MTAGRYGRPVGLYWRVHPYATTAPRTPSKASRRAFDAGARGTEVDIFFDTELACFVVSHDRPYNLKDGRVLTLGELFDATGNRGFFWLDFKKLRFLDRQELWAAVARLDAISNRGNLKRRIYVEGEAPLSLAAFRDAGFYTILDTHPLPDASLFAPALTNLYKLLYYFGDFTVMSMEYGDLANPVYGPRTRQCLGRIPLFLYHVSGDVDLLTSLAESNSIRVLLAEDHSQDLFDVNACPRQPINVVRPQCCR